MKISITYMHDHACMHACMHTYICLKLYVHFSGCSSWHQEPYIRFCIVLCCEAPYVRSKGRKIEKARGRRRSRGFKAVGRANLAHVSILCAFHVQWSTVPHVQNTEFSQRDAHLPPYSCPFEAHLVSIPDQMSLTVSWFPCTSLYILSELSSIHHFLLVLFCQSSAQR